MNYNSKIHNHAFLADKDLKLRSSEVPIQKPRTLGLGGEVGISKFSKINKLVYLILTIFGGLFGDIIMHFLGINFNISDFVAITFIFTILFRLNMNFESLKKYWIAFIFAFIMMIGLYFILPVAWAYSFAVLLAYVIADGLTKFVLVGGKGIIQIRILSNKTVDKGHGYLIFILMIIISTAFSGVLATIVIENVKSSAILSNLTVLALISLDYWFNYYERKK